MAQVPEEEVARGTEEQENAGSGAGQKSEPAGAEALRPGGLDYLLRKYLRVWIWSIIFGLDTTLTITLSTQSIAGRYPSSTSLVLIIPTLAAAGAVIMSWVSLAQFLTSSLMPLLRPPAVSDSDLAPTTKELQYLTLAMLFAILSVILRATGFIFEAIYGSLGKF